MKEEIPYITQETIIEPSQPLTFPLDNLIPEIVSRANMESSFDYVVSHLDHEDQRKHMRPKKKYYVERLIKEIGDGSFRITPDDIRTLEVTDGPKRRVVQCPTVYHRVGCHAIMVVVEKYLYPTMIKNTGASIKGRGMHWLFHIIEEDFAAVPELMQYYYQSDICHYYDNISQLIMKSQIREYISDPVLLPMLYNFVELLQQGLSKGLRSSQCFANLHLSKIDHKLCGMVKHYTITKDGEEMDILVGVGEKVIDGQDVRFLYYRYCDDIVMFAATKKELWLLRIELVAALAELGLQVKTNEAVRPLSEGNDFLGFVNFGTHARIRKRTKKKFAKAIKRVKSRKRRQNLIGSFFGMASHADCRHLLKKLIAPSEYKRLKHKRKMKDFGEFKLKQTTLDGKKNFRGNKISPRDLSAQGFIVVDFERGVVARRDKDDYNRRLQDAAARGISPTIVEKPKEKYVMQVIYHPDLQDVWCNRTTLAVALDKIAKDNRNNHGVILRKLWSGDRDIWSNLDQLESAGEVPFFSSIEMDYTGQYPKAYFVSPAKYGMRPATDDELDYLLKLLNLK